VQAWHLMTLLQIVRWQILLVSPSLDSHYAKHLIYLTQQHLSSLNGHGGRTSTRFGGSYPTTTRSLSPLPLQESITLPKRPPFLSPQDMVTWMILRPLQKVKLQAYLVKNSVVMVRMRLRRVEQKEKSLTNYLWFVGLIFAVSYGLILSYSAVLFPSSSCFLGARHIKASPSEHDRQVVG
jgi:hypothetical protein